MRKYFSKLISSFVASALIAGAISHANAGSIDVYVGYADGIHGEGFFPGIWDGSPNTVFVGTSPIYDAGAIRIDNNGAFQIKVDSVNVSMPWSGYSSGNLWGSNIINPGEHLILTQTAFYNFDTSDYGISQPVGVPLPDFEKAHASRVDISVNGSALGTFFDTGHILTTGGFDYASIGNESFDWRLIGTTGITDPSGVGASVPEPSTFALLGLGGIGLVIRACRRRRPTLAINRSV